MEAEQQVVGFVAEQLLDSVVEQVIDSAAELEEQLWKEEEELTAEK